MENPWTSLLNGWFGGPTPYFWKHPHFRLFQFPKVFWSRFPREDFFMADWSFLPWNREKKSAGWSLSKKILTGAMVHFADCRLYKHRLLAGENRKLWEIDSQPKMSGKPLEKAINAKMVWNWANAAGNKCAQNGNLPKSSPPRTKVTWDMKNPYGPYGMAIHS